MQDNSKHNYDPELVDQGWSLLEKQLNEVLPQKPKRRFAWFWLPLLLAITTLTGTGLYMASQGSTHNPPQTPISSDQNKQPIAQIKNNTFNESADMEVNQAETTDIAVSDHVNSVARPAAVNLAEHTNEQADRNLDSRESNTITDELPKSDSGSKTKVISDIVSEPHPSQVINELSFDDQAIEIAKPLSKPGIAASVAVLPQSPIALLEETSLDVTLEEVELLSKNRQNWRFYAEGQLTIALGEQDGLSGIAAGVDRRLGKSWSLGLAIAYERSQQKLSTSDFAYNVSQAEADFINNSYPQAAYNVNRAYEAVSYDRLKGELHIHYQLTPRWRVGSGLSLAYYRQALVNASQLSLFSPGVETGAGAGTGSVEDVENSDERFNIYNDLVSVYEFDTTSNATVGPYPLSPNRWQMAGVLSAQYQISKRWATNLSYRHDLTKWQTSSMDFGSPSFVQFGLRYYFN